MTFSSLGKPKPQIAIVTVLYNSAEVLNDFLFSLDRQTGRDWVLVVVDNASTDDGVAMIEAWSGPSVIIRNTANLGFAAATNQGIQWARERDFAAALLLNNDTAFEADFMGSLAAQAKTVPAPILAPLVLYHAQPDRAWFAGGGFTWGRGAFQAHSTEQIPAGDAPFWPATFAPGCALLVAMTVFDKIGVLDEDFFVYWEDADFCMRCKAAGIEIAVLRNPVILHKVSVLTEGENSPFSIRMYQANQIRFLRKHLGLSAALAQAPLLIAKAVTRFVRRREPWSATKLRLSTIVATLTEGRSS